MAGKGAHDNPNHSQFNDVNHLVQRSLVRDQAVVHSEVRLADPHYLKEIIRKWQLRHRLRKLLDSELPTIQFRNPKHHSGSRTHDRERLAA